MKNVCSESLSYKSSSSYEIAEAIIRQGFDGKLGEAAIKRVNNLSRKIDLCIALSEEFNLSKQQRDRLVQFVRLSSLT